MMSIKASLSQLRAMIDELYAKVAGIAPAENALSNNVTTLGPAANVGPNPQVTFISKSFTPTISGKVLILADATGHDSSNNDPVAYQLLRDPTSATGAAGGTPIGPSQQLEAGGSGDFGNNYMFTDTVAVGTTHTWGLNCIGGVGNLTLIKNGCSFVILELPA
jgi:hypothetical protein